MSEDELLDDAYEQIEELGNLIAKLRAEKAELRRLVEDEWLAHKDPDSPFYNDCEHPDRRCQWCEDATKVLKEPRGEGR